MSKGYSWEFSSVLECWTSLTHMQAGPPREVKEGRKLGEKEGVRERRDE